MHPAAQAPEARGSQGSPGQPGAATAEASTKARPTRGRLVDGLLATAPALTGLVAMLALRSTAQAAEAEPVADGPAPTGDVARDLMVASTSAASAGALGAGDAGAAALVRVGAGPSITLAAAPAADAGLAPAGTGLPGGSPAAELGAPAELVAGSADGAPASDVSIAVTAPPPVIAELTEPALGELPDGQGADPIGDTDPGSGGDDVRAGTALADTLDGGPGDDTIDGKGGNDRLSGGPGNDHLLGDAGDDILAGDDGDDWLEGGAGNDQLDAGDGDDRLQGGAGADVLLGGNGNDWLDGWAGSDRLDGGPGDDVLVLHDLGDALVERSNGGNDTVVIAEDFARNVDAELDWLAPDGLVTVRLGTSLMPPLAAMNGYVQSINPEIENARLEGSADHDLIGDERDNLLFGNGGDNVIDGGGGQDHLDGGAGHDILYGGAGDDLVQAGDGYDTLYGGEGDDTFVLGLAEDGSDVIFDREGANIVRLDGADAARLAASLSGNDLVLTYDGAQIGIYKDYALEPSALTGIDLGTGPRSIGDFLDPAGQARLGDAIAQPQAPGLAEPYPGLAGADEASASAVMRVFDSAAALSSSSGADLWDPSTPVTAAATSDAATWEASQGKPEEEQKGG